MEQQPASVPVAKQAGETRFFWDRVEPSGWSSHMLTAPLAGVKDRLFADRGLFSLKAAHERLCQSPSG